MTSKILTRAALITTAILLAFACGRYLAPFNPTTVNVQRSIVNGNDQVDSLILSWCDAKATDMFTAAGLLRTGPPPIAGARVGFFPDTVRALANRVHEHYGIPVAVVLSQYALESRFGTSDLNALNFFGHKFEVAQKYGPQPAQRAMALTKEFVHDRWVTVKLPFAKYASVGECFEVHGKFLSKSTYYKRALRYSGDPRRYAQELGKYYATDPDYALKLVTIISRYHL